MEDFKKRTSVIWSNLSRSKTGYTFTEVPVREQTHSLNEGSSSPRFWKKGGVKKEDEFVDLPISTQALLLDDTPQRETYRVSPSPPLFTKSASLSFIKESEKSSARKSTFRDKLGISPKQKYKVEKSEPRSNSVTQLNSSVATLSFNDSPDTNGKMRMTIDSDPFLLKFVSTDQLRFKGLTAREAASRFPEHKIDTLAFFVPGGIYEEYPAGHWIKPDEYLDDYTKRGINWLELRTRQLACKVYLNELQIQKTMMLNSSWTGAEAFNKIIDKMFKHFSQEQRETNANIYTLKTHTLFIRDKKTNEGIWVQEDQVLEDFDALNNGGVEIRKREWLLHISLTEIRISDQIQVTIGDFITDDNANHITISVDPFTTVKEVRRKLVKMILKQEDPDDFLFYFPTNKNSDLTVTLRQSFEKVVKFSYTNTSGVWMVDDSFLSHYYNKYDGSKNNVIILKEIQRPVWFKLPNKEKQKVIVYEHDTVTQVVQAISHRVDLNNKDMFGLKIAREDGSEYSLTSGLTLREQGVGDSDVLTLYVKYPLSTVTKISAFDSDVMLYYQQVKSIVTCGRYTFPPKLIASLFALQLQSDIGECTPSLYKSGLLGTLDPKEFPSWALALESDILLQWKKLSSLSREEASGDYIQRLKDFSLEEPPKDLRKGSEVTVKGLSTMDFIKKTKYRLEYDFTNKNVHFFDPEMKKVLSIQPSQLSHVRIEKNEDSKILSLLNFLDPSIAAEKNIEINFSSNVEREYAYLVLNNFRGTANHVNLSIFVGTYNLGGAMPNNLEYFISNKHDIYVLGTQECKFEGTVTWLELVMGTLGTDFQVISDLNMWEMSLVIICRKEHTKYITNIETVTKATGIANVVGNKGGVSVSFKFLDTSFIFVCSHLPARAERLLNRNQDYQNLVESLTKKSDLTAQFHYVYWLGDLNYRIDAPREVITALIGQKNWDKLLTLDQLTNEKRANRTFCGFKEGKIAFPPTYRYDRGTNEWSKKKLQNVPSYCDRVLWRTLAGVEEPKLVSYNWAGELQTSDHRPVYSIFNVEVKLPLENILQPVVRVARIVLYEILIICEIEDNFPVKKNVPARSGSIAPPQESYLTIRAPFIQDVFQKQVPLTKVADPWRARASWTQHLEIIGPFSVLQSCIEHLFVQMFVVDDGSFGRASSMGHAVIPLKEYVDAGAPKRFEVPIGHRGLHWGTMTGIIDFS